MMECFADDAMNVSGISRRRILANIDYDVDGEFMCSTLIKDTKENDDRTNLKSKFHHHPNATVDSTGRNVLINNLLNQADIQTARLSNHKLELISKQIQEAETIQQQMNGKLYRKENVSIKHRTPIVQQKTSTLNTNRSGKSTINDELIYDSRKPFSDLSSIDEVTRLDNLKHNLKNMQMSSIDRRRFLTAYFNNNNENYNGHATMLVNGAKLDRNSLIEHENLRSEMYNNENSNFINQIKQIQNYHNNQIVHDQNEETWFCKTKLYDDTLDEIVRKWTSLDSEIWCKIILFERNRRVAKAYIRLPYLLLTGSKIGFDGYTIGKLHFHILYVR